MRLRSLVSIGLVVSAFAFSSAVPETAYAKTSHKTASKTSTTASSKHSHKKYAHSRGRHHTATPVLFSALVVDAETGKVIYEKDASATRYPASLTKMMTLYLTFDAIKKGKLDIEDEVAVSAKAASQPQTNIALETGERIPVRSAIESVVVRSANDSAMVLAEAVGGTEWNFSLMMTQKARELGMKNTVFRNPNGLPDNGQHTTAYDMARLAIALRRDFPDYYPFFKMQSFTYNGITYPGHNHVMERYDGADGVKTGYIRASGFNLVTSVKKNGYSIVAVIMGGTSANARDNLMINMLDRTFAALPADHNNSVAQKRNDDESSTAVILDDTQEHAEIAMGTHG